MEANVSRSFSRISLLACTSAAFGLALPALAADADSKADASLPTVVVIGVTPLPGAEIDRNQVAAPVQTATAEDIERTHALDLTAFMNRTLGSVYVNDVQNNPLQPDINYRGYTASPLLGTPQGLSVYMDGVRLNQPFGDVVSWDLIPREAISSMTLMPGSNPVFGLNTLGGALAAAHEGWLQRSGLLRWGSTTARTRRRQVGARSRRPRGQRPLLVRHGEQAEGRWLA